MPVCICDNVRTFLNHTTYVENRKDHYFSTSNPNEINEILDYFVIVLNETFPFSLKIIYTENSLSFICSFKTEKKEE